MIDVHFFKVQAACVVGLKEAVILQNIAYWVGRNEANEVHCYEGKYWTYNSVKAFQRLFPYLSAKQIRNSLKSLEDSDYLETGVFNKSAYDRTKWYTLTNKAKALLQGTDFDTSLCPVGQMSFSDGANENAHKGEPIPNINNNIKTTNNKHICSTVVERVGSSLDDMFKKFWMAYPKKAARPAALRAFRKINPSSELLDTMLTALEVQKRTESWQKDDGQYIPYPQKWLNQSRWEDEVTTTSSKHGKLRDGAYAQNDYDAMLEEMRREEKHDEGDN